LALHIVALAPDIAVIVARTPLTVNTRKAAATYLLWSRPECLAQRPSRVWRPLWRYGRSSTLGASLARR